MRKKNPSSFVLPALLVVGLFSALLLIYWKRESVTQFESYLFGSKSNRSPASYPSESPPIKKVSEFNLQTDRELLCRDIYQFTCTSKIRSEDPTGGVYPDEVGERKAAELLKSLIQTHQDWSSAQIEDTLAETIFNETNRDRIQKAFKWVRQNFKQWMLSLPDEVLTDREKNLLIARIQKTHLELPPPAQIYQTNPGLMTKGDVFYERLENGELWLRVGGAYVLGAGSWFNLIFTFSHEMAHAIDPCELQHSQIFLPSYNQLTSCFKKQKLISLEETLNECDHTDQISEIFSDWVAVQLTSLALSEFAHEYGEKELILASLNSIRDLCDQDYPNSSYRPGKLPHPHPSLRINEVFGHHPQIRQILGCQPKPKEFNYCSFEPFHNSAAPDSGVSHETH